MRVTGVALLILCIAMGSELVNSTGLFQTQPVSYDTQFIETINDSVGGSAYLGTNVQTSESAQFGVGDFVTGLFLFIKIFFMAVFMPFRILQNMGVPYVIAIGFSFPVYLIYIVAVIQFISGRYVE